MPEIPTWKPVTDGPTAALELARMARYHAQHAGVGQGDRDRIAALCDYVEREFGTPTVKQEEREVTFRGVRLGVVELAKGQWCVPCQNEDHGGCYGCDCECNFDRGTTGNPIDPAGIDHPKHYNIHPAGIECIDVIEHMSFNIGSVIKYVWRAGLKPGEAPLKDLQKARWYIEREISLQQPQEPTDG